MEYLLDRLLALRLDVIAFVILAGSAGILLTRLLRRHSLSPTYVRATSVVCGLLVVCAVLFVEYAGRQEHARLRTMLDGIAPSYAVAFEYVGYERLDPHTTDDDPFYQRLIDLEKAWLATDGAADDVYTLHRLPHDQFALIVDSETDYDGNGRYDQDREQRTPIGEIYDPPPEERVSLDRAFAGECVFDGVPSTDRWGTWVSSYAPIHDSAGQVIAVVGVDYEARSWIASILMRRLSTLCLFAMLLSVLGAGVAFFQMHRDLATQQLLAAKNEALAAANRDLGEANERALAAAKAKTEFLANMSHELRTPLTAILGFVDLLDEDVAADATAHEHVEVIRSNGQHLLTIISDILDLSKLESGVVDLQLQPCRAELLVWEIVALLQHQAQGKGIDLRFEKNCELPVSITTDELRLRQILLNLVGNAIKFTEQGSVSIRLVHDTDAGTMSFLITDTGVGIPRQALSRLFIPFSQVDSSMSRRQTGSGLGLSISRRLAVMLGGSIAVTSEVGQGSTFRLTIPAGEVVMSEPERATPPAKAATRPAAIRLQGKVLLAEDGPDNQRLIGFLLRKHGLQVDIVENGKLAVEALCDGDGRPRPGYDLVLMDMQMPEMDGYEATRTLRAAGFARPIVAVTAHAMSSDRDLCLAAGCDEFLTKPIDRSKMLETLDRLLAARQSDGAAD
ncbi:MAG: response regulator [Planctomycetes bacterium]|nr:response regulator [Planctomycetota bacterium]